LYTIYYPTKEAVQTGKKGIVNCIHQAKGWSYIKENNNIHIAKKEEKIEEWAKMNPLLEYFTKILEKTKSQWNIVVGHHPIFANGHIPERPNGGYNKLKKTIFDLIEEHNKKKCI